MASEVKTDEDRTTRGGMDKTTAPLQTSILGAAPGTFEANMR